MVDNLRRSLAAPSMFLVAVAAWTLPAVPPFLWTGLVIGSVVNVTINIFATGLTSYFSSKFLQVYQELNNPGTFSPWAIPVLMWSLFIFALHWMNTPATARKGVYAGVVQKVARGSRRAANPTSSGFTSRSPPRRRGTTARRDRRRSS